MTRIGNCLERFCLTSRQAALTIILLGSAMGCVTPIPFEQQIPIPSYESTGTTLVSVVDERQRVADGKPRGFIGVAHGLYGIPMNWSVKRNLNVQEGDKERDLAEFLRHRIVEGLNQAGWDARPLEQGSSFSLADANAALEAEDAETIVTFSLNKWYFSINLHWVSSFNFDTDTDVTVHKLGQGEVLSKNIAGRDEIEEQANQSHQNLILQAYRDQLAEILSDPEVVQALRSTRVTHETGP